MRHENTHRLALTRELTGEITSELIRARIRVARSASRVSALESLLEVVWLLERELDRPVTLLDLISGADAPEQARRIRLVRALRLGTDLDPSIRLTTDERRTS